MDLKPHPEQLRGASKFFTLGVPLISAVYLGTLRAVGGLEFLHLLLVSIGVVISLWSDGSRRLARIGLPFLLYGAVYDSMRWHEDYIRSPVIHVHEPYEFDLRLYVIHGMTPNESLQHHTNAVLDFFCGIAYTP